MSRVREFFRRLVLATRTFWVILRKGEIEPVKVSSLGSAVMKELRAASAGRIVMSPEHAVRTRLSD